jgi:Cu/Ag efflux pump CusA
LGCADRKPSAFRTESPRLVAAWLGSGYLSLGSIVGFVTFFGITMRNSIMMILHFEHPVPPRKTR